MTDRTTCDVFGRQPAPRRVCIEMETYLLRIYPEVEALPHFGAFTKEIP